MNKHLKTDCFKDPRLAMEIQELLAHVPKALSFLIGYGEYVEMADDLVDEPKNVALIEKITSLATTLFTSEYWQQNGHQLYLVEKLIHHTYFDMVEWELSEIEWKRRDARALNHCAYNMLFAVIILECGDAALRKISVRFREHAHERHINDPI